MAEVRFYHLVRQRQDDVLPVLALKAYEKGHRIVIRMPDEDQVKRMNDHLWTFRVNSFLPHGCAKDGHAELQPIWLTEKADDIPNKADVLILAQGGEKAEDGELPDGVALCCEMLNGHDDGDVSGARKRWKAYKDAGHDVTYWQQNERGGWEQKA